MNDRERLKAMIKPRSHDRGSWFVAHFRPCSDSDTWHPVFVEFMDLRHRLNADIYPCKFFEYCLLDGFNWAAPDHVEKLEIACNAPEELCCMKVGISGHEDCPPITNGQFVDDTGPIAEANRAAWRKFINSHRLDKTDLTRAADEMQPGIEYYITHNDFIGHDVTTAGHPGLEEPTPLPAWVAGLVEHEPRLCASIYWRKWRENGRPGAIKRGGPNNWP